MPVKSFFCFFLSPVSSALLCGLLFSSSVAAVAQAGAPAPSPDASAQAAATANTSAIVQPAISNVQRSLGDINIPRWKAPGDVRSAAEQNVASIQRDLSGTLPGLLTQADSAAGSVPPAFNVYRNLDALYDVLLRVYETALLAAPQGEVDELSLALQRVEGARSQLGEAIMQASQQHEADIVKLQAAVKAASASAQAAPPPKSNVIDDGPAAPPATAHKKKKPAPKPSQPAAEPPATPPANPS